MTNRRAGTGSWSLRRRCLGAALTVAVGLGTSVAGGRAEAAELEFLEVNRNGEDGVSGLNGVRGVTLSPDGAHLYATGAAENALVVFEREVETGALTFVEVLRDGMNGVDGLDSAYLAAVSPDGAHVYVAGFDDDSVAAFRRNPGTGALSFLEVQRDGEPGVDGLDGAVSVVVSPDGAHVYVAAATDDALAVFSRSAMTGLLTFVEFYRDGVEGVDGLENARSVAISSDGSDVYVASNGEDAIAVFNRDASTGALTFVEVQRDGQGGVDGLDGVSGVTVSPDDLDVYGAAVSDSAVPVFARDAATGALTFTEREREGSGGVVGLRGALTVAVSPNGQRVYAGGVLSDAVVVFARDAASGELEYLEVYEDGVDGVDGLEGVNHVTLSPDGRNLYAGAFADDAVAVFAVPEPALALSRVMALAVVGAIAASRRRCPSLPHGLRSGSGAGRGCRSAHR